MDIQAVEYLHYQNARKSLGVAYLLWFFFGFIAAQRIYLGAVNSAVGFIMLWFFSLVFTISGVVPFAVLGLWFCVVWWLADAFLIPRMTQKHNDVLIEKLKAH